MPSTKLPSFSSCSGLAGVEHDFHPLAAFQLRRALEIVLRQAAEFVLFADKALILLQQDRFRIHQQFTAIAIDNQRMAMQQRG